MKYENRLIVFTDLLGFGQLVDRSLVDAELVTTIADGLKQIHPDSFVSTLFGSVDERNYQADERDEAQRRLDAMSAAQLAAHPIQVSYFSDCIVASSPSMLGGQLILERLAYLTVDLWRKTGLLLRGGICIGELLHEDKGPMFGPAMNCAYKLESKIARHPRIIVGTRSFNQLNQDPSFGNMASLFNKDGEYSHMSLGTAFRYLITDSTLSMRPDSDIISALYKSFEAAPAAVREKGSQFTDSRIAEKYEWLEGELADCLAETPNPIR